MRHLNSGFQTRTPARASPGDDSRNLVTNLIEKERIHTTLLRAKATRPLARAHDHAWQTRLAALAPASRGISDDSERDKEALRRISRRALRIVRAVIPGLFARAGELETERNSRSSNSSDSNSRKRKKRSRQEAPPREEPEEKEEGSGRQEVDCSPKQVRDNRKPEEARPRESWGGLFSLLRKLFRTSVRNLGFRFPRGASRTRSPRLRRLRPFQSSAASPISSCAAMPPAVSIITSPTAAVRPGTKD